jgi:hypothetical protein
MKKMKFAVAALAIVLGASTAMAGWKTDENVVIGYITKGALGTVRTSNYPSEDIGCVTDASYDLAYAQTSYSGHCWATDKNGWRKDCYTDDADMVRYIATLKGDSHLGFAWSQPPSFDCIFVAIGNASDYRPKSP